MYPHTKISVPLDSTESSKSSVNRNCRCPCPLLTPSVGLHLTCTVCLLVLWLFLKPRKGHCSIGQLAHFEGRPRLKLDGNRENISEACVLHGFQFSHRIMHLFTLEAPCQPSSLLSLLCSPPSVSILLLPTNKLLELKKCQL